jgi:hypothetical protein
VYQEYYYTNGAWEKIGTHAVKVDLTPYAKKTEAVRICEEVPFIMCIFFNIKLPN